MDLVRTTNLPESIEYLANATDELKYRWGGDQFGI